MTRRTLLVFAGTVALAVVWLGPLPALARQSFSAHMAMHMAVVAAAAPLLALGIAGRAGDPVVRWPRAFAPIGVAVLELAVVWTWHAPALHHAVGRGTALLVLQQLTFLGVGLLLWLSAFGGNQRDSDARRGLGAVALLFTSMHMTLLGALLALAQRPFYHHLPGFTRLSALEDQQLGGTIMILVGGLVFLCGGVGLIGAVLRGRPVRRAVS